MQYLYLLRHSSGRQQLLQPFLVEAHHYLAVNNSHRGSHYPDFDQLGHSRHVSDNILFLEVNSLLRKKLFRPPTEDSTRLRVNNNFFRHWSPPIRILT